MNSKRKSMSLFYLLIPALLWGCQSLPEPKLMAEMASIYGTISTQSHKQVIEKKRNTLQDLSPYNSMLTESGELIDYKHLKDLFVCLSPAVKTTPKKHLLKMSRDGFEIASLAFNSRDKIEIENHSKQERNLFVTDSSEGFQDLGRLEPGDSKRYAINLTGVLMLGFDEDEREVVHLNVIKNGLCLKKRSGDSYQFESLTPGDYRLHFWYWRLGEQQHAIHLKPKQNRRVDQILSVDRLIPRTL